MIYNLTFSVLVNAREGCPNSSDVLVTRIVNPNNSSVGSVFSYSVCAAVKDIWVDVCTLLIRMIIWVHMKFWSLSLMCRVLLFTCILTMLSLYPVNTIRLGTGHAKREEVAELGLVCR